MKLNARQQSIISRQPLKRPTSQLVPYKHVAMAIDFASQQGLNGKELLNRFGFEEDQYHFPDKQVSASLYSQLLLEIDRYTTEGDLWFRFGERFTFVSIGDLGHLLATSLNGREAIRYICEYYSLISCGTSLFWVNGDSAVTIERNCPALSREAQIKTEILLSSIARNASLLTRSTTTNLGFEFDYLRPSYYERYEQYLGSNISFNKPQCRILLSTEALDQPISLADEQVNASVLASCEQQLENQRIEPTIEEKVRSLILSSSGLNISREQTAQSLAISTRTLNRRLAEIGLRFDLIQRQEKHRYACRLLEEHSLTVNEIAFKLAFDSPSNFTRFFTRESGLSPSKFRLANTQSNIS